MVKIRRDRQTLVWYPTREEFFMRRSAVVVLMLALLIACRVWADDVSRPKQPAFEQRTALLERFEKEIWPVLTRDREGKSCVGCHNDENPSVP